MQDFGTRSQVDIKTRNQAESVVERVFLAVEQLCIGRGDVRKRLIVAIELLLPLQEQDFPESSRIDFLWIISQATKFEPKNPKYEGTLEATMRRIKNSTGEKLARRIFKIYSDIQDIRGFPLLDYRDPHDNLTVTV